jgi:regulator of protease activity HflC (stomatin/prohibitin superfamily)
MKQNRSPLGLLIFIVILGLGAAVAYATHRVEVNSEVIWIGIVTFVLALVVSSAVRIADQWDKVVILRLGHFHSLKGPGLFFIIPERRA